MYNTIFKPAILSILVASSLTGCNNDNNALKVEVPNLVSLNNQNINIAETRQWIGQPLHIIDKEFDLSRLKLSIYENDKLIEQTKLGQHILSHGIIDTDLQALRITYIPMKDSENRTISYRLSDGNFNKEGTITIDGHFLSDPMSNQQWHLHNTGQTAYSMQPQTYKAFKELLIAQGWQSLIVNQLYQFNSKILVSGQDMNVLGAYKHNITGKGTIVVVVDTGLAINHENLVANVLPNRSINFINNSSDPTLEGLSGDHGTSVAGLIAAQGWNGLGGRGVAPEAKLIGMNYLSHQKMPAKLASYGFPIISGISKLDNVVAFNRSYGFSYPGFNIATLLDDVLIRYPSQRLRDGKGALNIKSSGNSFISFKRYQEAMELCSFAQSDRNILSCADSNWDPANASFYTLTIGAVNSDGKKSSYSTAGSSLWASAPAGEYGTTEPAMITTDQMSCQRGYSSYNAAENFWNTEYGQEINQLGFKDFYNQTRPFNAPDTELNKEHNTDCNYTNTFNGTSSAAPNVSGVVALIAQANPELNWREIRYILAKTADKVDSDDEPIVLWVGGQASEVQEALPDDTFIAHLGWVENAAGFHFNNKYGFGRVNAGKAVELAKSGNVSLPPLVETDWIDFTPEVPMSIPDANAQGIQFSFTINNANVDSPLFIEGIQFGFNIYNDDLVGASKDEELGTTAASDIAIKVTSPAGTQSILATSRTALGALGNAMSLENNAMSLEKLQGYAYHIDAPILTNAFFGESIYGEWKVTIVDTNGADFGKFKNNQQESQLIKARMRIYGH
ncbi:S8 family serine peptidase [Vibrio metschnikovii]|uniref:S8 family serine peptidase n=1 Tax=Vibrio metschnikovii TaxID=28172 RepID=UPI00164A9444|nr:S8 family serine peptidase [Vibrio metschnikovii]MBC5830891.1 S8 family serine peptidase [Vibrio metschnikovii]